MQHAPPAPARPARYAVAILLALGLPAMAAEPESPAPPPPAATAAERLAATLQASKDCQTSKVEAAEQYQKCRYTYRGLRFAHVTMRPKASPGTVEAMVQVEYQEPGMVSVQLHRGKGRCLVIADGPSGVTFGVETGKIRPLVAGRPGPDCDTR
jgi:hypothetical protein